MSLLLFCGKVLKPIFGGEIISCTRENWDWKVFYIGKANISAWSFICHIPVPRYIERLSLQSEFDILMTQRTTELLPRTRSTYFEHGDKASRLLAHQLRKAASSNQIPQIQTDSGITTNPLKINSVFKELYMSLLSSFDDFFNSLNCIFNESLKKGLSLRLSIRPLFHFFWKKKKRQVPIGLYFFPSD